MERYEIIDVLANEVVFAGRFESIEECVERAMNKGVNMDRTAYWAMAREIKRNRFFEKMGNNSTRKEYLENLV